MESLGSQLLCFLGNRGARRTRIRPFRATGRRHPRAPDALRGAGAQRRLVLPLLAVGLPLLGLKASGAGSCANALSEFGPKALRKILFAVSCLLNQLDYVDVSLCRQVGDRTRFSKFRFAPAFRFEFPETQTFEF